MMPVQRRAREGQTAVSGRPWRDARGRRVNGPASGARKTVRQFAGHALLVLGAMGIFLPIIPGIPLFIAGAALLGSDHPAVRPLLDRRKGWRSEGNKAHRRAGRTGRPGGEARTLGGPATRREEGRHR